MASIDPTPARRVMIGTPCYDGRLDVSYVNSLYYTTLAAQKRNVHIMPLWVSYDALIQRARNDTLQLAVQSNVDDLVWIDSDIEWEPAHFFRLLDHDVDVVGGTYPKKSMNPDFVFRQLTKHAIHSETHLMQVDGLGTGFARMSKKAIQYLWNNSEPYVDPKDMKQRRMICDVIITNQGLMSEDIFMFDKLQKGGFPIWLDTQVVCNHMGTHKFHGDFMQWYTQTGNMTRRQL